MNNEANPMTCTYNVHLRTGMIRTTGREAVALVGWEGFNESDYVEHSEWCPCRRVNVDSEGALIDPFLDAYGDTSPPF